MLERVWRKGNSLAQLMEMYLDTVTMENSMEISIKKKKKKLGIKPYDPAIPFLGIYPEKTKIEKDTCIPMFIVSFFTIARTWKQPRCPSTDEWIKKLWCIYTMEYYSAIKEHILVNANEVDENRVKK